MRDKLVHYGTPRHSGRYPWGSGEDPKQRNRNFLSTVSELQKQGLTEKEIAKGLNISINDLRNRKTIARNEERLDNMDSVRKLTEKGYSNMEISRRTGLPEATVRSYKSEVNLAKARTLNTTIDLIRDTVDSKDYVDVGVGVERYLGISQVRLKAAIAALKDEGYQIHHIDVLQLGTNHKTRVTVLAKPGIPYGEVSKNRDKIHVINAYSEDNGASFERLEPIRSIDSKRIYIRYDEDGGSNKDGTIELRRGVDELSLGSKKYAQVRIGVDGKYFLKGMALYSDDVPEGYDIMFNTNKSKDTPPEKVFKPIKDDPENPFGALIRQKHYLDAKGAKQLSALNIVGYKDDSGEEGAWGEWSKVLSSQMLSKQPPALAKKQLDMAYDIRKSELNEILSLTNPVVKEKMLQSFADDADSAAVHLKAASLPRQKTHVILPLTSIKDTEIYAPNYDNGERVVLIRHPHGGIFEIPQLIVNNNNREGKKILGNAEDAVGINPKTAQVLSGADFDGDTVLVIPNPPVVGIKTAPPLKGLMGFEPKITYKNPPDAPETGPKSGFHTQSQMGSISNLITDMTIQAASLDEIERAVKHSMVVIDAEKHNLNYKQSYIDNGIAALKVKYQGGANRGASTLISKAKGRIDVPARKDRVKIDPETGEKIYIPTGEMYVPTQTIIDPITGVKTYVPKGKGEPILRTMKSTKMAETSDAHSLSSGTLIESMYANHANKLKGLANEARKESLSAGKLIYSSSANEVYKNEVASLNAKLNVALKNAPLERKAQLIANAKLKAKKEANPDLSKDDIKKLKVLELNDARNLVGAKKVSVEITDKEWEAIQSGAITQTTLKKIIDNTDLDRLKELATPRSSGPSMNTSKINKAKALLATGYTQAEVAKALGVSVSTLSKALN